MANMAYMAYKHMANMHIQGTETHHFQPVLSLGQLEGLLTLSAP